MITHVAIMTRDKHVWSLPKPNRHGHVIHEIHLTVGKKQALHLLGNSTQGFVNDKGKFLDRVEGWREAKREKQILPPYDPANPKQRVGRVEDVPGIERDDRELFSEDLW